MHYQSQNNASSFCRTDSSGYELGIIKLGTQIFTDSDNDLNEEDFCYESQSEPDLNDLKLLQM